MKISNVRVWLVEGVKYNWTLLKIYTDTGATGIGEATNWPGSPIVESAVRHAGERIIGLDPLATDYVWSKLYRDLNWIGPTGASLCAISGIDMALLDLKAKHFGMPLYHLLGGPIRRSIRLYANYWFTQGEHTASSYASAARKVVDAGFRGLKFDPFAHVNYLYGDDLSANLELPSERKKLAVDIASAVRDTIGPDADMMIETHALLNFADAVEMAQRLSPLRVTWFEEPVGPENPVSLAELRRRVPAQVPICVGERHYTRSGFRPVFESHACDFIMPDITRCGGPSELKRIATMAEAYNVQVAPHNPNGPLSTLASAHVCATIPNFFRQEFMFHDVSWRDEVISRPLPVRDGYLELDEAPGLGVDLLEEELEKHPGVRTLRSGFYV
ncbi:MAG: mandelate racemase/muconate lactonizing enzyme family protein [Spirochaetota bacterium]